MALLLWNAPDAPAGHMSIRTNWKGEESAAQLTTRAIDVPPRIKRELRDLGTIHPPEQVHLVIATWPGVDSLPRELQITYDNHSPSADLVTLFTD